MPQKVNPEKSDLSVSIGAKLRRLLVEACLEDEIRLSQATKEAIRRWLASRERKGQRMKSQAKNGSDERIRSA
jgi:hypothetical protein